jgi:hypothetical protein
MKFKVCIACYRMITCYEDGKILCQSRGFIQPPIFCDDYRNREEGCIVELRRMIT